MSIDPTRSSHPVKIIADITKRQDERAAATKDQQQNTPVARRDSVEISQEARNLAESESLGAERLGEIRERIAQEFYSPEHMREAIAQRILLSGDL